LIPAPDDPDALDPRGPHGGEPPPVDPDDDHLASLEEENFLQGPLGQLDIDDWRETGMGVPTVRQRRERGYGQSLTTYRLYGDPIGWAPTY